MIIMGAGILCTLDSLGKLLQKPLRFYSCEHFVECCLAGNSGEFAGGLLAHYSENILNIHVMQFLFRSDFARLNSFARSRFIFVENPKINK